MTALFAPTADTAPAVPTVPAPLRAEDDAGPTAGTLARPAVMVVIVEGELDSGSVARVRETLHDALSVRPGRLVVDLAACPFVDACALTMLLDVHRRAWRSGGVLTLRACSPRVLRLLSLTGLRRVFDLAD
jgi:anti-anti-sigma factor